MRFRLYDPEQMRIAKQCFRRMGPISLAILIFSLPTIVILTYRFSQMFPSVPASTGQSFNIVIGLVCTGSVMSVCFGAVCMLLGHPIRTVYIALTIGLVCETIATILGGIPVPYLDHPGAPMMAAVWISSALMYSTIPKSWKPDDPAHCPVCSQDLTGLPDSIAQCPQCGGMFRRKLR